MIELYRERLTALGHRVTIFTFGPSSDQDGEHTVRIPAVPLGKTGYFFRPNIPASIIEELNQMDIVHCHHLVLGPEKLAGKLRCPLIYTNHTRYDLYTANFLPIPHPALRTKAANWLLRRRWPSNTAGCQTIIAPSGSIQQTMRHFGVSAPIQLIHNGIDLSQFSAANQRPPQNQERPLTAVYLGRLSPEKNIPLLIDSLIEVCRQNSNITFKLIGDGPLFKQTQSKITAAQLTDQIQLTGWIPASDIPNLLADADFQITMSVTEVHPLAMIEGMAAGLPAVVLTEPAMVECVGPAAIIAHNPTAWIDGVLKMAQSAEVRRRLAAECYAQAQKYDINTTVSETLSLYHQLICPKS